MTGTMRAWHARLGVLVTAVAVAACQSTPAPTPSGPASAPATTPVVSAAPSPSAAPVDVVALFTEKSKDFDSGVMTLSGTTTVGLIQVAISGDSTFSGPDSRSLLATTVGGVQSQTETVQVAGKRYSRSGDGPWLEVPVTSSSSGLSSQISSAAKGSLTDEGTEQRQGQTVHKLVPSSTSGFDPSALVGSAAGVTNVHMDLAFFVAEDGTPVAATISATWTQTVQAQSVDAKLEFNLTFSHLGQSQTIRTPDGVWVVFKSDRYHFSMAHPAEWTYYKAKGADELDAPYYAYVLTNRGKTSGTTLNEFAKHEAATLKTFLGGKAVSNESATIGGVQARFLSGTGKAKQLGKTVVAYEAVAVKGGFVYFVIWVSEAGHETDDRTLFAQMLGTFAFT